MNGLNGMTYFGVPILDWVLLVLLIGLGIEAYVTTRPSSDEHEQVQNSVVKNDSGETEGDEARSTTHSE